MSNKNNNTNNNPNWSDEMNKYHHNHQPPRHQHRGQMSADYRDKIPPNEDEGAVPYETEQIVDSEWEDFEKLLR